MKSKLLSGLICSLIIVVCSSASGETVTLQQGTGEYSGCSDSYTAASGWSDFVDTNYGNSPTLLVNSEQYNPG